MSALTVELAAARDWSVLARDRLWHLPDRWAAQSLDEAGRGNRFDEEKAEHLPSHEHTVRSQPSKLARQKRSKTIATLLPAEVDIAVRGDRDTHLHPQLMRERQRTLSDLTEVVHLAVLLETYY